MDSAFERRETFCSRMRRVNQPSRPILLPDLRRIPVEHLVSFFQLDAPLKKRRRESNIT